MPHHQTEQVRVSSSQRVHLLVQGAEWSYQRDQWKERVPESLQTNLLMEQVLVSFQIRTLMMMERVFRRDLH